MVLVIFKDHAVIVLIDLQNILKFCSSLIVLRGMNESYNSMIYACHLRSLVITAEIFSLIFFPKLILVFASC